MAREQAAKDAVLAACEAATSGWWQPPPLSSGAVVGAPGRAPNPRHGMADEDEDEKEDADSDAIRGTIHKEPEIPAALPRGTALPRMIVSVDDEVGFDSTTGQQHQ